jgi:PAS domain S-box-containing protein
MEKGGVPDTARRYAIGVLAALGGVVLRLGVAPVLKHELIYITFFPAVMVSAWYGGLGPGLLTMALSLLATTYVLHEPPFGFVLTAPLLLGAVLFVAVGALICWLTESLRAARMQAEIESNTRKRYEEDLKLALRASNMGTWARDLTTGRIEWSPELEQIFGLDPGSFTGTREELLERVHPEDRARYVEAIDQGIREGTDYRVEFRYFGADGEVRWMEGRGRAVKDKTGKPVRMAGIGMDITAQKSAEQALLRSNEELQQFGYIVSHDLKQPLRQIAIYVDLLGHRYEGKLDEEADQFIKFARDGANRMQRLIDALLEYARVGEAFKPATQRVSTEEVMRTTLQILARTIEENAARVTVDPLPDVRADEFHVGQIFQNLVENALKYRRDVPPEIHVSSKRGVTYSEFLVRDNGIGIEPRHQSSIFAVFHRLHGSNYDGVGIGLATCRKIVEKYGGRIWVESQRGEGSTFHFTLPAWRQNV